MRTPATTTNADLIAELPGLESSDDRLYFRHLHDGLSRVSELVDSYRDRLSGAADMYLSTVANRQGVISEQLTITATIFLPLTFLTGFFGQNLSFRVGDVLTGWRSWWLGSAVCSSPSPAWASPSGASAGSRRPRAPA